MSLHDTLARLNTQDDDATAYVIAVQLNADQAIRKAMGAGTDFTVADVKRVARALADHAALEERVPRADVVRAIEMATLSGVIVNP